MENSVTKGEGKEERSSYSVSFVGTERKGLFKKKGRNDGTIRIKMKFKEKDEPEAVARVREMFNSTVG